ncbi:MAG: helix-turn-helix transcriptional regulator [Betaproteobacteria bacterium]|nr:helix-turn-helix transcriptional regulator [Betaproteobacteria bacterium]
MSRALQPSPQNITGRRIRALREELAWSQERLGVAIGIDESSARARISRYELGVHEPPLPTIRLIADALNVPLSYLYCEDDRVAMLLLGLHRLDAERRSLKVEILLEVTAAG